MSIYQALGLIGIGVATIGAFCLLFVEMGKRIENETEEAKGDKNQD